MRASMAHEQEPADVQPADVPKRMYWLIAAALGMAGTALAQCMAHHGLG